MKKKKRREGMTRQNTVGNVIRGLMIILLVSPFVIQYYLNKDIENTLTGYCNSKGYYSVHKYDLETNQIVCSTIDEKYTVFEEHFRNIEEDYSQFDKFFWTFIVLAILLIGVFLINLIWWE